MKYLLFVTAGMVLIGCSEVKKYKISYHENGSKKSEGFYVNDKPIDTLFSYYENGKRESIEVFDSESRLNGVCTYYYSNGLVSEIIPFDTGKINGEYQSYFDNGVISKRAFFYEGLPMGDAFYYDSSTSRLKFYNFSDFNNKGLLLCEFNDRGEVLSENEDFFFTDSVFIDSELYGNDSVSVLILISHRPKSTLELNIESLDSSEKTINKMEIDTKQRLAKFNFPISESARRLRMSALRYDSVKNKEKTFIIVRNLP